MLHEILLAVAFTYTLGLITTHPPLSGVLSLGLTLAFASFVLWLRSRPKAEAPEIRGMRSEVLMLREQVDTLKSKVDGLILGGRRGG